MSIKLDDLLNEKKGPAPVLDLFKTSLTSRSDFEAALQKVPEYKIRPEKVREDEVTGEGPGGWRYHGGVCGARQHPYADPLPPSMQGLNMQDFYQVDIDWRMLTTSRPQSRVEEEVFSRHVEMGRLQLALQRQEAANRCAAPTWKTVKVVPGRGAVSEVRIAVCPECADELCAGRCHDHLYTNYQRQEAEAKPQGADAPVADGEGEEADDQTAKKKKKIRKKKGKSRRKKKVDEGGDESDD